MFSTESVIYLVKHLLYINFNYVTTLCKSMNIEKQLFKTFYSLVISDSDKTLMFTTIHV